MSRCHTNLSQSPVRLRDTRYCLILQAASDPGPGSDVWLKCLPRPAQAQAQWSFLEITSRDTGYTIPVAGAGYRGYHDIIEAPWISVTMTTLTRLSSERGARVWGKFSYSRWWTKRGYYWEWDWADLAEMGHQYFFCVSRICRSHKLA